MSILIAIVESWDPDWAGVISRASRAKRPFTPGCPFVDWMFYQKGVTAVESTLPVAASTVQVGDLGSVIITQSNPIDANNKEHQKNVMAVNAMIKDWRL